MRNLTRVLEPLEVKGGEVFGDGAFTRRVVELTHRSPQLATDFGASPAAFGPYDRSLHVPPPLRRGLALVRSDCVRKALERHARHATLT